MLKAAYDFDAVGQGRLAIYLPVCQETTDLRMDLRRRLGKASVEHMKPIGRLLAEEWFVNAGKAFFGKISKSLAWRSVFG